jgi:SEC-C motif-containing protein
VGLLSGDDAEDCPCGSGVSQGACCGPYLVGTARAPTAEALMRSRYTAFVRADLDHLFRTWHPRTRPDELMIDPRIVWTGLEVQRVDGGGVDDETGEVTFLATCDTNGRPQQIHERSTFERRGGRWVYVGGEQPAD